VHYCTYASPLALRKSRRTREIAARAGVWATDEVVRRASRFDPATAVSYWQTVDGGSVTAGGRGSAFTGGGADLTIYDDPLKNREEAESPVYQEKAIETARMLATRLEPGASMFVTHQPWNDLDPIAVLGAESAGQDGQAWERISLPVVIDAVYDDETGRLIGGTPLWPARWSLEGLARIKHDVGDYNWFSQYTLDRHPRGERVFHEPARYETPTLNGAVVIISCDPGLDEKKKDKKGKMNDSSGIVVASAYHRAGPYHTAKKPQLELRLDILFAEDQWRKTPDLLDHLEVMQAASYRGAPVILEEVSAFKTLSDVAAEMNPNLRLYAYTPHGSKLLRAQPCAKAWNKGRIRVPLNAPWVADFLKETTRFTGKAGGKDNRVDAMTQLYDYAEHALAAMAGAQTGGNRQMAEERAGAVIRGGAF
jgi:hypothetical protein